MSSGAIIVLDVVAGYFGVTRDQLTDRDKSATMARARWLAMFVLKSVFGYSSGTVGGYVKREHSTVLHGWGEIEALLEKGDVSVRRDLLAISELLKVTLPAEVNPPPKVNTITLSPQLTELVGDLRREAASMQVKLQVLLSLLNEDEMAQARATSDGPGSLEPLPGVAASDVVPQSTGGEE